MRVELQAAGTSFDVELFEPAGEQRGAVIVIHEIWGLTEHIRSVAARVAALGYVVAAPDLLSHAGVAPALGRPAADRRPAPGA